MFDTHSHSIVKCSCGAVLAQCRCPDNSKPVETIIRGCMVCRTVPHDPTKPYSPDHTPNKPKPAFIPEKLNTDGLMDRYRVHCPAPRCDAFKVVFGSPAEVKASAEKMGWEFRISPDGTKEYALCPHHKVLIEK